MPASFPVPSDNDNPVIGLLSEWSVTLASPVPVRRFDQDYEWNMLRFFHEWFEELPDSTLLQIHALATSILVEKGVDV